MARNVYNVGDVVVVTGSFSDPESTTPPLDPDTGHTLVNPATVLCRVRDPHGARTSPAVSVDGFVYSADVPAAEAGTFWYRFYAPSGQYQGAGEDFFQVREDRT